MNFPLKHTESLSLWQRIKEAIARFAQPSITSSNDVRVWKLQYPNGHSQWKVSNTTVRQSEQLNSEAEVMEWIEESYHHTGDAARQFWFFL